MNAATETRFRSEPRNLADWVRRLSLSALFRRSAAIAREVQDEVTQSPVRSPVGTAVHTRRGKFDRAVRYAVDLFGGQEAVIGTSFAVIGLIGSIHEFGRTERGVKYPQRPVFGPVLERQATLFGQDFTK